LANLMEHVGPRLCCTLEECTVKSLVLLSSLMSSEPYCPIACDFACEWVSFGLLWYVRILEELQRLPYSSVLPCKVLEFSISLNLLDMSQFSARRVECRTWWNFPEESLDVLWEFVTFASSISHDASLF